MSHLLMQTADRARVAIGPRVIVLGRQGAGKGTQCARLARHLGVPHISSGDLFRAAIAAGTPLGNQARRYVDGGALVPDDLVLDLVASHLSDARTTGYLLDGFPRTLAQGQAFFEVLGQGAADVAIELDVPADAVLQRLLARRVCGGCGSTTASTNGEEEVTCRSCGDAARRRDDDTPEAITRRLSLYDEESGPLLIWLADRALLVTVDGRGSPDEVFARIAAEVDARLAAVERPRGPTT